MFLAQCPREGCDGAQAFFYQVQIRSADEPMTTFYKVGCGRFPVTGFECIELIWW
jgi:DNA-directed RNA polymerase subunit M/transcription elongation factor TFIIS